jgi:hypothetical protein
MRESSSFANFCRAFTAEWFTLMSSGISVPLAIAAVYVDNAPLKIGLGITAFICFVFAAYRIWQVEREAKLKAEAASVALQARFDERRCTLSIQPIKCIPGSGGYESWRKEIKNDGPAVADAVHITLTEISPSPKFDPHLADNCPQKVFHWHRTFEETRNILVGHSEFFEPININQNGLGVTVIGGIDTAYNRRINMEIGEEWTLHYRVSGKNAESAEFTLLMRRNDDGLVVVNEIH